MLYHYANGVDTTEVLNSIDESDLKEFGLNFGERRKLALAIDGRKVEAVSSTHAVDGSQEASAGGTALSQISNTAGNNTASQGFQVAEIMKGDPKGKDIIQQLEGRNVSGQELVSLRKLVVKILTKHLTEKAGDLYPRTQEKEAMAKALVTEFPCFKDRTPGCKGYELFFSEGEGFIEWRLKTMRQSAKRAGGPSNTSQLKKKTKNDTDDNETEQCSAEVLEQMEWLKYHPPTRENSSQIKANLKATFSTADQN
ncbi:uncharacterized protein [Amphiura filiformis]|uniref:uncharacterized protein isoform X2 n=1 Tax=Amphiura filiformis TaxID=82378 RepID=UPI003B20C3E7